MTYGSEMWPLTDKISDEMQTVELDFIGRYLQPIHKDKNIRSLKKYGDCAINNKQTAEPEVTVAWSYEKNYRKYLKRITQSKKILEWVLRRARKG